MERRHLLSNLSFIDATDPQGTFDTGQDISLTREAGGLVLKLPSEDGLQLKHHDVDVKSTWPFWEKRGKRDPGGGGPWRVMLLFKYSLPIPWGRLHIPAPSGLAAQLRLAN